MDLFGMIQFVSTIWFELLTGEFPFRRFHPDTIVWQVGKGIKPALNNLHAAREIKVR